MEKAAASFIISLLLLLPQGLIAQQTDKYEKMITESGLRETVDTLCTSRMEGRGSGTAGGTAAGDYILSRFIQMGLSPFYYSHSQTFYHSGGIRMRNVLGVVPALEPSDRYIVISAHYDHLGKIKGKVYPGADDNASGVAAMLAIADMFSNMRRDSIGPSVNILFAAFDGKEYSMTGSNHFVSHLPFAAENIVCEINMDIFGSTLVPVHKNRPDYLIVLGSSTLAATHPGAVSAANYGTGPMLDIDYTFYGSSDFTKTMYKLGDHYPFYLSGIPALFFTSGFHEHTLKTTDTPHIIDYPVLAKRTRLVFRTVYNILQKVR